jgi:hypothetical protein
MNRRRLGVAIVLLGTTLLNASGCALASDFDKATLVGEIGLEKSASLRRELMVPKGRARLMIAIRNFHCAPMEATIRVTVVGSEGNILSKQVSLSQLTWSYGKDSCDAIGYLESSDSHDEGAAKGGEEMRLQVNRGRAPYTFDVTTMDSNSTSERRAALWLIYGDRVPTARIFGPGNGKRPR